MAALAEIRSWETSDARGLHRIQLWPLWYLLTTRAGSGPTFACVGSLQELIDGKDWDAIRERHGQSILDAVIAAVREILHTGSEARAASPAGARRLLPL